RKVRAHEAVGARDEHGAIGIGLTEIPFQERQLAFGPGADGGVIRAQGERRLTVTIAPRCAPFSLGSDTATGRTSRSSRRPSPGLSNPAGPVPTSVRTVWSSRDCWPAWSAQKAPSSRSRRTRTTPVAFES